MLVIDTFEEEGKTKVILITKKKHRDSSKAKAVRRLDNGKPLCGVLEALAEHENLFDDLDSLVQAAFDLGREYAERRKRENKGRQTKEKCKCVRECDCECPEPDEGTALVSNECPIHNMYPDPHPDCRAEQHFAALPTKPRNRISIARDALEAITLFGE